MQRKDPLVENRERKKYFLLSSLTPEEGGSEVSLLFRRAEKKGTAAFQVYSCLKVILT